jgi:MerR family transcriptional regulator, light-induced transcriptional regulator
VPDGGLAAGAVARLLGVSVTTLRTWHQRYGLGPSLHRPGHHRRYSAEDMGRLQTMVRLTGRGVPAAEAARAAMGPGGTTETGSARDGGGHTIPVGRAGPAARGLARAAMRMDAATMVAVITTSLRERGVVDTWDGMLAPVLIGIGERHAATRRLVEVEHLLSRSISDALATVPRPHPTGTTRILLACADEEQHSLALEALAAALAERGCASRLLGARVPGSALAEAVRRTGPAGVVVWSQVPETASAEQVDDLLVARPRPIVVAVAGPGWSGLDLPEHVHRPASLVEAFALTAPLADP